jgi:arginine/ornithine transport system substrate-binding protein
VTPDGQLAGFDVDIANALCAEMKAECTLVKQDWDGMIPALLARKYDAIIASMSITDERKERVDFTDKYYHTPARLVVKKGDSLVVTPEGLAGKKIGVQRETIHDKFATDNWGDTAEIVRYATQDEANLDAVAGRVDALLADMVVLDAGFLKTDAGKGFEFTGPEFNDPKWFGPGAGIAVRKQDKDLTEKLNQAIAAIRANGTYDKIAKKYFDFNVYGS